MSHNASDSLSPPSAPLVLRPDHPRSWDLLQHLLLSEAALLTGQTPRGCGGRAAGGWSPDGGGGSDAAGYCRQDTF